jgi:hypothetical protein
VLAEREAADSGGCVLANTGELCEIVRPAVCRNAPSGPVEVDGPPVVPKSLPSSDDLARTGRSERLDRWPALNPRLEPRHDPRHLCLLEHHLRREHRVRVAAPAPGKITAMLRVPDEQRRFHRGAAYSGSLGIDEAEESRQCGGPCADTERPSLSRDPKKLYFGGRRARRDVRHLCEYPREQRSQSEDDEDGGNDEERDDD